MVFSCAASRNKQGRCCVSLMATSFGNCLLRFAEPRGPDASPSGGPQTHYVRCVPPGRPTRPKAQPILCPNSVGFGLRAPGVGRTAQRASPAILRTVKAQPIRSIRDNSSPPAEAQRAPTNCSPPRGVAANCAALRVAKVQPQIQTPSTAKSKAQYSAPRTKKAYNSIDITSRSSIRSPLR